MSFVKDMLKVKTQLEKLGHKAVLPEPRLISRFVRNPKFHTQLAETGKHSEFKRRYDLIRKHYQRIVKTDAILVVNINYQSKGIKSYIGANTFLEMGFAHVLGKPIFALNPLPESSPFVEEMNAMDPIILNGSLSGIAQKDMKTGI